MPDPALTLQHLARLLLQLLHRCLARAASRLVGGHDHALHLGCRRKGGQGRGEKGNEAAPATRYVDTTAWFAVAGRVDVRRLGGARGRVPRLCRAQPPQLTFLLPQQGSTPMQAGASTTARGRPCPAASTAGLWRISRSSRALTRAVQRSHRHECDDGGAVGVGDDAALASLHARHGLQRSRQDRVNAPHVDTVWRPEQASGGCKRAGGWGLLLRPAPHGCRPPRWHPIPAGSPPDMPSLQH